MKIVNHKQFIELPAGVLFSKYVPCYFEEIQIKGETLASGHDFCIQEIADAIDCSGSGDFSAKCIAMEQGVSACMDFDCEGRDGCFNDEQLFAVWELADLTALIARLLRCVPAIIKETPA